MRGKLYGVGVGPGDPMLMTRRAVQVIEKCPVIAVPSAHPNGSGMSESVAYRIASAAVELGEKECLGIYLPMTRDEKELERCHEEGAQELETVLNMGQDIAFLTLGDPTIYATYMYLHQRVEDRGYETEIVSGIPSFCAAAASLQISLAERSQQLHIIPAGTGIEDALALSGTKVFMKAGRNMGHLREILRQSDHDVCMVENCGMEGERKYYSAEEIDEGAGYYSLVIAKETSLENTEERQIFLVGIGTGCAAGMTGEARKILAECDLFVGAERMLEVLPPGEHRRFVSYRPQEIGEYLRKNTEWSRACILLSGDVGFYSGAKGLMEELKDFELRLIPGISSVAAMCARLGMSWEDMELCSVHGKGAETPIVARIRDHRYTFWLLGGEKDLHGICQRLMEYGMDHVTLYVGERLGYDTERIVQGRADQIAEQTFDALLALVIENPQPTSRMGCEIADDEWIRGRVPMTKSEVRSVILSKLGLDDNSILYDMGAGTGSVGIQAALWQPKAQIYAIERQAEGCDLIWKNQKKFLADNVSVIHGEAPEALSGLPAPTHVFIGGSGGRLREMLSSIHEKNPDCRIVISAVSLDTLSEVMRLVRGEEGRHINVVQLSVSREKEMGDSHLMIAQNPVYIITMGRQNQNGETE